MDEGVHQTGIATVPHAPTLHLTLGYTADGLALISSQQTRSGTATPEASSSQPETRRLSIRDRGGKRNVIMPSMTIVRAVAAAILSRIPPCHRVYITAMHRGEVAQPKPQHAPREST
jgi:hypothetical protein